MGKPALAYLRFRLERPLERSGEGPGLAGIGPQSGVPYPNRTLLMKSVYFQA